MKQLLLIFAVIAVIFGGFYSFGLPRLIHHALITELKGENIAILETGNVKISFKNAVIFGLKIQTGFGDIEFPQIRIVGSPLNTFITNSAESIVIEDVQIFYDGSKGISSDIPQFITAQLWGGYISKLTEFTPNLSIPNITYDLYTSIGLISFKGDGYIQNKNLIASVSTLQKQLTLNADIRGSLSQNGAVTIDLQNLNADGKTISLKRGYGKIAIHQASGLSGVIKTPFLRTGDTALGETSIKITASQNETQYYAESDGFRYWHNRVEGQASSHLETQKHKPSTLISLYSKDKEEGAFSNFLDQFLIDASAISIQGSESGQYRVSAAFPDNNPLLTANLIKQGEYVRISIDEYDLNQTQFQALWKQAFGHYLTDLSGSSKINGHSFIKGTKLYPVNNLTPLTLKLRDTGIKNEVISLTNMNGEVKLSHSPEQESFITFDRLNYAPFDLRSGRLNFNLSHESKNPCSITNLRAKLGSGQLIVNKKSAQNHIITTTQMSANALPRELSPFAGASIKYNQGQYSINNEHIKNPLLSKINIACFQ